MTENQLRQQVFDLVNPANLSRFNAQGEQISWHKPTNVE